jgi:hypothetical protein
LSGPFASAVTDWFLAPLPSGEINWTVPSATQTSTRSGSATVAKSVPWAETTPKEVWTW